MPKTPPFFIKQLHRQSRKTLIEQIKALEESRLTTEDVQKVFDSRWNSVYAGKFSELDTLRDECVRLLKQLKDKGVCLL
jgi:hypothetical protein